MSIVDLQKTGSRPTQKPKPADVGVISKVLRIFEAIQASPLPLQLREICKLTGINKATAYRFLAHLQREGYVFRDEAGAYSFGMKLLQLGARSDHRAALQEMARPALRRLWTETQETVNLAVLDEGMILYVHVIESPHEFRFASKVGMRRPIYSTALGKALAAFLPEEGRRRLLELQSFQSFTPHTITSVELLEEELERVRRRGYAIDDEESVLGARCIGAPILNHRQEPLAAISVSGPTTRLSRDKIPALAAAVKEAADAISAQIGCSNPSKEGRPS